LFDKITAESVHFYANKMAIILIEVPVKMSHNIPWNLGKDICFPYDVPGKEKYLLGIK